MTHQENCLKSAKNRDYTFVKNNYKSKNQIKAKNLSTQEVFYFNSMYSVQKELGINHDIVKMVCEGLDNCKSGRSKFDDYWYRFEYVN